MNEYQTNLYNGLMDLVSDSEAFYFGDVEHADGTVYRIFNYRMANYTEFLRPYALECRGTMFEVDGEKAVRLAAIAFPKFFNLNENPMTMDLDLTKVKEVADKADGSLINPFLHMKDYSDHDPSERLIPEYDLLLKSKGSIGSDQAIDSTGYLYLPENEAFRLEIDGAERLNYTLQLEWVAPHNRIVIGYEKPELRVLGIRSREDGSQVDFKDVDIYVFPEITKRWTKIMPVKDVVEWAKRVPKMTGIEGYVYTFEDNTKVKHKTDWYFALHHTKDSINSPRRLFEAVLEEATDDMRSLFFDDKVAIRLIEEMEEFVEKTYNHMVDQVERYYERNKDLSQKEYAIKGQAELTRMYFGLAMNKYTGRSVDYKAFLKKQWKKLGLKDKEEEINE